MEVVAVLLNSAVVLAPGKGTSSAAEVVSVPAIGLSSGMDVLEVRTAVDSFAFFLLARVLSSS